MFNVMKKMQFLTITLLLASALLLPIRLATAQLKATLEGHTDLVWSVAFRPNGVMLASVSWDRTVRLWNVNTGRLLHTLTGHTNDIMSVALSPDGQTLASGSWDGTIRLWNPNNGKHQRTVTGNGSGVASVVFSPDGQTLVSGNADRTIQLWNTKTWKLERTLKGHTDVVEVVAFSPDGRTLASGSRDTTIRLWNPQNGTTQTMLTEHTAPVNTLTFSPDGKTLASGSRDRSIRLWNPNNGKHQRTLAADTDGVNPVVFSPDGKTLLIGGRGISIWDTETGQYKKPLAEDVGGAISVVFSPDGRTVVSGSTDHKVRVWEFNASDYEIPSITTNGLVRLVYFLPNDRPARRDRIPALRQLIKDTQQFFADQMQSHGFGRKTFSVETGKDGEPVVHRINGKFDENYYNKNDKKVPEEAVWEEIVEHFDDFQHIYFIVIDVSSEALGIDDASCGLAAPSYFSLSGEFASVDGLGLRHRHTTQGEEVLGGMSLIPASGPCFEDNRGFRHKLVTTIHELGHTFGLEHDFREGFDSNTAVGGKAFSLSKCDAEWLSVSRFFNSKSKFDNAPGEIRFLPMQTYNQETISLRFQVTDPDGLYQAQLLVPAILEDAEWDGWGPYRLFDCKRLNGKTGTVASAIRTAEIADRVTLQIIDVNGNITWATFPIKVEEAVVAQNALDINSDGIVNILDLTPIDSRLGRRGQNPADVNGDRVVNTRDLLLVAAGISSISQEAAETFDATKVQKWLTDANQLGIENEYQQNGIVFLERLVAEIELSSKSVEVATGPLKAIFGRHTDFVPSITFSPDGQTLASGSWDRTIRLWTPHTGQLKTTLIGHTSNIHSVAFSPDGQTLGSVSGDTTIRLWDPRTGELKTTPTGHKDWITSVVFSPDGQTLASGGAGGKVLLRNTDTGQLKETLTQHSTVVGKVVESVAFSPDGQTLASGNRDETIRLWNPNNGRHKRTLTGHTGTVNALAFSPDGQTLASGSRDRTIRLWNPQTGELKTTLTGYTDWINPVAFSPDGQYLVCGRYNTIRLWNTQTGEYKNISEVHTGHILSITFSPDGTMLASGGEDNRVLLWDVQTVLEQSPTVEVDPNKITGPWLWMITPTRVGQGGARSNNVDSLAVVSGGNVTEADVAENGAREGDSVGNYVWTLGEIAETGDDNINEVINNINMAPGDVDDHSSYALITLESATAQSNVTMQVGSDDSVKVWLNGEVVHNNPIDRGAEDFQDRFTVDLKQGDNLLLVKVGEREGGWSMFVGIGADVNAVYKRPPDPVVSEDVNGDGIVNILDLVSVSANFGKTGQNPADVNGDGVVNIVDLVKVAGEMGAGAAAPSAHPQTLEILTAADVRLWLTQAQHANLTDVTSQRGILMLEQLLSALIPKETSLLPNYPNPFNPETWIPYQLSEPAAVTVHIYTVNGTLIRTLALGHLRAGMYHSKNRAAYWDGRNNLGEPVASGIYFYTLIAGDFTATRKMLIRK